MFIIIELWLDDLAKLKANEKWDGKFVSSQSRDRTHTHNHHNKVTIQIRHVKYVRFIHIFYKTGQYFRLASQMSVPSQFFADVPININFSIFKHFCLFFFLRRIKVLDLYLRTCPSRYIFFSDFYITDLNMTNMLVCCTQNVITRDKHLT